MGKYADEVAGKMLPVPKLVTPEGFEIPLPKKVERLSDIAPQKTWFESRSLKLSSGGEVIIPGNRNNEFSKWFDKLSSKEIEELWQEPKVRETIEDRLRHPGGFHEWLPVSRVPKFKEWGITAQEIMTIRSKTKEVKFANPSGRHGGKGSTTAHNELFDLIDKAKSFEEYKKLLKEWASKRLEDGVNSLPENLR